MNGAQALIRTLANCGVDVCFTNPGTSEMHFVAALDAVPEVRAVLALFEGVATGAADGYARVAGKPAATLLHLGPGLGNGWANLHNAKRGFTPIVNIVGDHATYHKQYDAPLNSDIGGLAHAVSGWVHASESSDDDRGRRRRRRRRRSGPAGTGRDADPARRRELVRRPRTCRASGRDRTDAPERRPDRRGGRRPPVRGARRAPGGRTGPGSPKQGWWRPHASPRQAVRSCSPRRSRRACDAAPASRPSSGSATWRSSWSCSSPASPGSSWSTPRRR